MIIVELTGGLGNQLFQYAIGKALSVDSNDQLLFDTSSYLWDKLRNYELNIFNFNVPIATVEDVQKIHNSSPLFTDRILYKVLGRSIPYYRFPIIKEQSFKFDSDYKKFRKRNINLQGYWQSEKYFKHVRSIILEDLKINENVASYAMKMYKNMILETQSSVSIHIRRGDYVSNPATTAYHGLCDLEYYNLAMQKMESHIETPTYFIFSDDKEYVKSVFGHIQNTIIVENVMRDYEELILMSMCNHNIIANSSFSWWGAWLNANEAPIVIAPKIWFNDSNMQQQTKDLLPIEWIKM
jgi:hypothetical protein